MARFVSIRAFCSRPSTSPQISVSRRGRPQLGGTASVVDCRRARDALAKKYCLARTRPRPQPHIPLRELGPAQRLSLHFSNPSRCCRRPTRTATATHNNNNSVVQGMFPTGTPKKTPRLPEPPACHPRCHLLRRSLRRLSRTHSLGALCMAPLGCSFPRPARQTDEADVRSPAGRAPHRAWRTVANLGPTDPHGLGCKHSSTAMVVGSCVPCRPRVDRWGRCCRFDSVLGQFLPVLLVSPLLAMAPAPPPHLTLLLLRERNPILRTIKPHLIPPPPPPPPPPPTRTHLRSYRRRVPTQSIKLTIFFASCFFASMSFTAARDLDLQQPSPRRTPAPPLPASLPLGLS